MSRPVVGQGPGPAVPDAASIPSHDALAMPRRQWLRAAALVPAMLAPLVGRAQQSGAADVAPASPASSDAAHEPGFWALPRTLWLRRPATREELRTTYWADGAPVRQGYIELCAIMRDVSMERRLERLAGLGRAAPAGWYYDAAQSLVLLDILYAVTGWLRYFGMDRPLILDSGFRHPITNMVTEGAARNSAHQRAGAADIVIPGVNAESVGRFGLWLRGGGVGFYPTRGFTHVDDGRLRSWMG